MSSAININATSRMVGNCTVVTLKSSFYQQINTEAFRRNCSWCRYPAPRGFRSKTWVRNSTLIQIIEQIAEIEQNRVKGI